jgi:hypothetical protein
MAQISETSVREFLLADKDKQKDAWYDWFCKDKVLPNKTKVLTKKLKQIVNEMVKLPTHQRKFDVDTSYVFFKNNCPMRGQLYDSMSICEIGTGEVLYYICPKTGQVVPSDMGRAEVSGKENEFKVPLIQGDWRAIVKFFAE